MTNNKYSNNKNKNNRNNSNSNSNSYYPYCTVGIL